jgi:hypothetical protein
MGKDDGSHENSGDDEDAHDDQENIQPVIKLDCNLAKVLTSLPTPERARQLQVYGVVHLLLICALQQVFFAELCCALSLHDDLGLRSDLN